MEMVNGALCLTFRELTGGIRPAVKGNTLQSLVRRGKVKRVQRGGGLESEALYEWRSLPRRYRDAWTALNGDPEQKERRRSLAEATVEDGEARQWYSDYTYGEGGTVRHLTEALIGEYTANASALRELLRLMGRRKAMRHSLSCPQGGTWEMVLADSERLREAYGHTLPTSVGRLRRRVTAFERDGYASLLSGKLGNQQSLKMSGEMLQLAIALKRSKTPVYTDRQLMDRLNEVAAERGWTGVRSMSTLRAWLYSPQVEPLWYDAVHGEQAARQRFNRKHKTVLPLLRDALWYGDGTKLNLYYRDDRGRVRTKQVYEVIDAMSEVMLGYCISDTEDYEAQYRAYRMAVMVSGHRPYEVVHDNQGGHGRLDSDGLMGRIAHVHRTTQPYNGESKTIESVFGRFQAQVLHKDWRFTGQNVTARKASSRPDVEFVEANKDRLYTLEELEAAYASARREWNEAPHPATGERRIDMYERSVNEKAPAVTVQDMVDMFWVQAARDSTFTDQGLQLTVGGVRRQYEVFAAPGVPDHEWRRRHTWERFAVKYDPCDMTSVRLYSRGGDGSLRFERTAEPYMAVHRALQDQEGTGDAAFIRQEQAAAAADRLERTSEGRRIAARHGMLPEQHGLTSPRMKGADTASQRELERRTAEYSADPVELGRRTKAVSLDDWRTYMTGRDDGPGADEAAMASKM